MTNLLITFSLLTAWACGNASVETVPSAEAVGHTQDNEKTLAVLKQLLESSQENEENNSLDGPIIHFVFELVLNESKKNQDAKFDNEFLINIMKKLPLPPQTRYSTEIMTLLTNDFMSNTEKFGFLSFQCLLSIVELLISQNISLLHRNFLHSQKVFHTKMNLQILVHLTIHRSTF